jgi:hypothetical protein
MRKLILFSLFALCAMALPLHAQNVWSSKIDTFGNYIRPNSHAVNGVVSLFTPATAITVNRIQLVAAGGQVCTSLPGIKVISGTTSSFLSIPNTTAAGGIGPVSNDSGPISLSYTAGEQITVKAVAGSSGCNPYEINITVQYSDTP